jgi:hypothetical protein
MRLAGLPAQLTDGRRVFTTPGRRGIDGIRRCTELRPKRFDLVDPLRLLRGQPTLERGRDRPRDRSNRWVGCAFHSRELGTRLDGSMRDTLELGDAALQVLIRGVQSRDLPSLE